MEKLIIIDVKVSIRSKWEVYFILWVKGNILLQIDLAMKPQVYQRIDWEKKEDTNLRLIHRYSISKEEML